MRPLKAASWQDRANKPKRPPMLLVYKDFEWDLREAAAGPTTHGVSFREASTVFADENVIISEDPGSDQLRAVGVSSGGRMLVVLHRRGHRIRILGATLHTNDAIAVVAREHAAETPAKPATVAATPAAAEPVVAEPIDMEAGIEAHQPSRRPSKTAWPAKAPGTAESSAPSPRVPATTGWTAETYGVYWDAYSSARQAARRDGKSPREAQRLGREAGERAMAGRAERSPKQSARAST